MTSAECPTFGGKRYVVVSRGRRDYFEVPLALAEVDRLDALVTDRYLPEWGGLTQLAAERISLVERRYRPGLPTSRVIRVGRGLRRKVISDRQIGAAGRAAARAQHSTALVYSYYLEGFLEGATERDTTPVVFQVHPVAAQVRAAMECCHSADLLVGPEPEERLSSIEVDDEIDRLHSAARVLTASRYSRQGLIAAGLNAGIVRSITYGGDRARLGEDIGVPRGKKLRLLYVGQISRRKGVGSLLAAMKRLDGDMVKLTIVSRDERLSIYRHELGMDAVEVKSAADRQLQAVFREHDVLVLPSYIEGAGLVLSEALSSGLWILGTPCSAAPELIDTYGRGFLVNPGDPEALAESIETLVEMLPELREARREMRASGSRVGPTWEAFRGELRAALDLPLSP